MCPQNDAAIFAASTKNCFHFVFRSLASAKFQRVANICGPSIGLLAMVSQNVFKTISVIDHGVAFLFSTSICNSFIFHAAVDQSPVASYHLFSNSTFNDSVSLNHPKCFKCNHAIISFFDSSNIEFAFCFSASVISFRDVATFSAKRLYLSVALFIELISSFIILTLSDVPMSAFLLSA